MAIAAIIVVALLAWFGASRGQEPASINAENISTTTITTGKVVGQEGATASTEPGSTEGSGAVTTETASQATVSTSLQTTSSTVTGGESAGGFKLVVNVTEGSCWLVVREDSENGAEVYAGTLSAGGQQSFDGANRYWLMVGKPEWLTVSVGSKSYTLAEPAGAFVVTAAGVERSE